MKVLVLISLILSACAMKPFSQDLHPDGKTWTVAANDIKCPEASSCKAEVKRVITARGKLVCGAQPFRVISCDSKTGYYGGVKAHCLIRCGEAPVSADDSLDAEL